MVFHHTEAPFSFRWRGTVGNARVSPDSIEEAHAGTVSKSQLKALVVQGDAMVWAASRYEPCRVDSPIGQAWRLLTVCWALGPGKARPDFGPTPVAPEGRYYVDAAP